MTQADKLFTLAEVEYLVKNGGIVPFAMAKQLAETMRENERIRKKGNIDAMEAATLKSQYMDE